MVVDKTAGAARSAQVIGTRVAVVAAHWWAGLADARVAGIAFGARRTVSVAGLGIGCIGWRALANFCIAGPCQASRILGFIANNYRFEVDLAGMGLLLAEQRAIAGVAVLFRRAITGFFALASRFSAFASSSRASVVGGTRVAIVAAHAVVVR